MITLNLLLSGLQFEIKWMISSGMVLFVASEVPPPLFLARLQPANSNVLVSLIFSQKGKREEPQERGVSLSAD
jgi:hypothetical protein